jgi:hypothetical protein
MQATQRCFPTYAPPNLIYRPAVLHQLARETNSARANWQNRLGRLGRLLLTERLPCQTWEVHPPIFHAPSEHASLYRSISRPPSALSNDLQTEPMFQCLTTVSKIK